MVPVLINDRTVYEYDKLNCTFIYIQTEFFYLYYKAYLGGKSLLSRLSLVKNWYSFEFHGDWYK